MVYTPQDFREERQDVLLDAIKAIHFGAVITYSGKAFTTSHLPLLVNEEKDKIILEGHVARANPLWKIAVTECPVITIFQGPHAYIHPGWYETKKKNGRVVPTWNYQVIHCHGRMEACDSKEWLLTHLEKLTHHHESSRPQPWTLAEAPKDYIEAMVKGIVGLKIYVEKIEGVWKMSQNHPLENRLGVIEGLSFQASEPHANAVSAAMQALESTRKK